MTSTNVFSGNFVDKPTSRVLKPPGGGNSNIFGLPDEPSKLPNSQKPVQPSEAPKEVKAKPEMSKPEVTSKEPAPMVKVQSFKNKFQGGSFNPITGEPVGRAQETAQDKPTKSVAVKQPPGGASSKLW